MTQVKFTSKDHGKGHGISYYLDGVKMLNIKTRKNGQGVVFFTKNSGIDTHEKSRIDVYLCELAGDYKTVLAQAQKEVLAKYTKKATPAQVKATEKAKDTKKPASVKKATPAKKKAKVKLVQIVHEEKKEQAVETK